MLLFLVHVLDKSARWSLAITEFTAHGSTCTFLVRYMKDHFPSHTAVISIGLHGLSPNPASLGYAAAGAAPHHRVTPRFTRQSPLARFPYSLTVTSAAGARLWQWQSWFSDRQTKYLRRYTEAAATVWMHGVYMGLLGGVLGFLGPTLKLWNILNKHEIAQWTIRRQYANIIYSTSKVD